MPRKLYSPRLSDDVVRLLYQEGKRRRMPMTRLADELLVAVCARNNPTRRMSHPPIRILWSSPSRTPRDPDSSHILQPKPVPEGPGFFISITTHHQPAPTLQLK